ncbi:MAG: bifunctional 5,10-methylenetetrahydrofolate dehydrogenase/5,10-methenyltetrahydrofolate cyclohydrolase [bacterium]|nr:bifunctional 5,10-methylenetetrahydrofolate dehydrogenase/5,10-methenyltetrahydrofolate cyclohydrolase [bacterium]
MIIDGKKIADEITQNLSLKVQEFKSLIGRAPKLAIVLVGDDPASKIYVNLKVKKAQEIGIETEIRQDLDTDADGIIVQLPGGEDFINQIPLEKDVDGLREGSPFLPATVKAILVILASEARPESTYVIVGQGRLVGKPLVDYLEKNNFKVIRCDEFTKNLKQKTLQADVLVVATGVENLIKKDMVKKGVILIDCGAPKPEINSEAYEMASAYTPVPGGVGPVTVVSLLENLVEATYNKLS